MSASVSRQRQHFIFDGEPERKRMRRKIFKYVAFAVGIDHLITFSFVMQDTQLTDDPWLRGYAIMEREILLCVLA